MAFTLAEIAARFGGRVVGAPQVLIRQVGTLERAGDGQIAFLANPRYRARLAATRAAAVIVGSDAEALTARPRIVCDNPYAYFARVSQLLNPPEAVVPGVQSGARVAAGARIDASARIDAGASVEAGAAVGPGCWIGTGCFVGQGTELGEGCRLYPSVVIYAGCRLGARVVLHSGVVIGADGFGIAREDGRWIKIPQIGRVVIGDDVEIGANTTIDRGAIEDTVIEEGVKLDNQIQIGHNCRVGAHTAMAGCVAVAGSADIGRRCTIGAGAIILGHLSICDDTEVSADTVISRSIRQPGTYTGMFPFDDNRSWARNTALVRHLAELAERVRRLERQLQQKDPGHG
ncbi:MAG: UDP-3-O-(3-hydroxymyristoyl)glucosamine N-acyltransferase [Betaproteobacteria bacterium]|nr:MAG: UDP-3-O-(3-hydroxymyristoyl)glucosamine N-acyltransferase [Betaproteobacteria bacterium]